MELFRVQGVRVWVDGAHNLDSVSTVIHGLQHYLHQRSLRTSRQSTMKVALSMNTPEAEPEIWVVFGAGAEKSVADMIVEVARQGDRIIMVQSNHFKALGTPEFYAYLLSLLFIFRNDFSHLTYLYSDISAAVIL